MIPLQARCGPEGGYRCSSTPSITSALESNTPRPHFTPGKDSVPILQENGWAPGLVWTGGKSRPHRDMIPDRPVRSSVAIPTELPKEDPYFLKLTGKMIKTVLKEYVDWIKLAQFRKSGGPI